MAGIASGVEPGGDPLADNQARDLGGHGLGGDAPKAIDP